MIQSTKKFKAKDRNRKKLLLFTRQKGVMRAHTFLNDKVIFAGRVRRLSHNLLAEIHVFTFWQPF